MVHNRVAATLGIAVLLAVGGCGGGAGTTTSTSDQSASTTTSPAGDTTGSPSTVITTGFPVTIEHEFGSATVEAEPQRIVAVDLAESEIAVALGEKPVGISAWFNEMAPWFEPYMWEPAPELLLWVDGIDIETVATLDPDLILGGFISEDEYDILSQLAPTIQIAYEVPFRDRVLTVGRALGKVDTAEAVADDLDAEVSQWAAAHPELAGKTISASYVTTDGFTNFSDDVTLELANKVGLVKTPALAGVDDWVAVSAEELGVFDADLMIVFYETEDQKADIESLELFQQLEAVEDGHYFGTADINDFEAFRATGVLQIPFALDTFFARLAEHAR